MDHPEEDWEGKLEIDVAEDPDPPGWTQGQASGLVRKMDYPEEDWEGKIEIDVAEDPDPPGWTQGQGSGTDIGGGMAAKHQHDTRGVSPPQQHAVGQGRVDQHENSPSRVNAGRHGNSPSRVNAGRHRNSPSRVNAGRHEVKASRPSDEANCASGGGGFLRETRAGADQPLHSGSDGRRGSHSSDAGLSLTGLSSQGVGRGEPESPRLDATGQRGDPLASQPACGGGRGDGDSCRRDVTGQPGGARGGRRNSAGRQAGLRGYLSNQTGGVRLVRKMDHPEEDWEGKIEIDVAEDPDPPGWTQGQASGASSDVIKTEPITANICSDVIKTEPITANICSDVIKTEPITANICSDVIKTEPITANICSDVIKTEPITACTCSDVIKTEPIAANICSDVIKTEPVTACTYSDVIKTEPITANISSDIIKTEPITSDISSDVIKTEPITANICSYRDVIKTESITANISSDVIKTEPITADISSDVIKTEPITADISTPESITSGQRGVDTQTGDKQQSIEVGQVIQDRSHLIPAVYRGRSEGHPRQVISHSSSLSRSVRRSSRSLLCGVAVPSPDGRKSSIRSRTSAVSEEDHLPNDEHADNTGDGESGGIPVWLTGEEDDEGDDDEGDVDEGDDDEGDDDEGVVKGEDELQSGLSYACLFGLCGTRSLPYPVFCRHGQGGTEHTAPRVSEGTVRFGAPTWLSLPVTRRNLARIHLSVGRVAEHAVGRKGLVDR
ncbi:hypothetical protein ACOMHN_001754 [Nucella lapillus]